MQKNTSNGAGQSGRIKPWRNWGYALDNCPPLCVESAPALPFSEGGEGEEGVAGRAPLPLAGHLRASL